MLPALARLPAFWPLALSVFCLGFGSSITMPFMALFGVNFIGMTPLRLGLFLSLTAISGVIISTRLARFSDRLHRHSSQSRLPLVLLCLGAGILSALSYSLLPQGAYLGALLTGALLQGVSAAAFPQLFAFARSGLAAAPGDPPLGDLPERALTVLRSVFSLAWVVGPGLGALALSAWGFQGAFRLAAGCWVLATLPLVGSLLMRKRLERASGAQSPSNQSPPNQLPHVQVEQTLPVAPPRPARALPWVVGAFVLYGMSLVMGMNFLPLLVTKTLGGDTGQVGFLVSFCAFLEIPIMLALVMLRRLPSLATLIKLALALLVAQFALTALAQGLLPLVLSQVLRAAGIAVMAGLGMTYFQKLMPGRSTAATTLFANTTSVGGVLSGVVSGAWAQVFGYRSVFVLCAALGLVAWGVMEFATRRRGEALPPLPGAGPG